MVFDIDELSKIRERPNTPKNCVLRKFYAEKMHLLDFSPLHEPLEVFVYDGSKSASANLQGYLRAINDVQFPTLEPELREEFLATFTKQLLTELPCVGPSPDILGFQESRCPLYGNGCRPIIGFAEASIFPIIIPVARILTQSYTAIRMDTNNRTLI